MDAPTTSPSAVDSSLRLALQAVPGGAVLVNARGVVTAANETWGRIPERNPFVREVVPGTDYLAHCRALVGSADGNYSLVAVAVVAALEGRIRHLRLEYPLTDGGAPSWYAMTATGLQDGSGAVVAHLDVTDRMAWERRMRRTEQLFRATTENALDLIALVTMDGRTVYASPSYEKTLGCRAADLAGGRLLDLVTTPDQPAFLESCRIALAAGISPLFEYQATHRDGHPLHLEARAVAVDNPGGERDSLLLVSRDVTAKKAAEAERSRMEVELRHAQKMEAVGQLSAGIAHEINTPCQFLSDNLRFLDEAFAAYARVAGDLERGLAAAGPDLPAPLAGLAGSMEEADLAYLADEVPRALKESLDGLARIARIVQAMKVFGHPGGEGPVPVDLNETLRNTVVVAQGEWKYVAEVALDLAPDLPRVSASPGEMNQVILNLVINAAHAVAEKLGDRPGEKGRIGLSTRLHDGRVEVSVEDTGVGIPEAIRDKVFLPFFTTKPVGKGTGQGLAIVHSVVVKNGGSIDFESQPGSGTRFILRLPALEPPADG